MRNRQVSQKDFNSYGSRRGNHEIMVRGTFANVRIKNLITKNEGGYSFYHPDNSESEVFEVAKKYSHDSTPLIVIAGKEYGTDPQGIGLPRVLNYWELRLLLQRVLNVYIDPTLLEWVFYLFK